MKLKNILFITVATISTITIVGASTEDTVTPSREERSFREYTERKSKPSDTSETPISSKTVRHDKDQTKRSGDLKRRPYRLEDARIYFDVDRTGKPCYRSIQDHLEKNPQFNEVELVLYHEAGWFSPEKFEQIGYMGDENAREKLKNSIAEYKGFLSYKKKNGTWCPQQNVFIGGADQIAPDRRYICEMYARFLEKK